MTASGWALILLFIAILAALAKPIGAAELLRCVRDCITRH